MVKKTDGSLTENPSETLDVMTEVHFATQVEGVYPPTDTQTTRADDTAKSRWGLDHIFSENRVKRALQEFSPDSCRTRWDKNKACFRNVGIASSRHLLVSQRQASC